MTDEPATTPTCGKCGSDLPERGCCPCIGATPDTDRVTALTLRCDDLREQRDQARRAAAGWEETADTWKQRCAEARAQVVACQTAADDLRARCTCGAADE